MHYTVRALHEVNKEANVDLTTAITIPATWQVIKAGIETGNKTK